MITAIPFDAGGEVNATEYRRQIEHQIHAGISIIQCPLAEELYYMSGEECLLVMKTLAETCRGKALSCAIASHSPSVDEIVENARRYEAVGIDVIKVLCPLHYGMDFTPEDIYAYYAQVIEAVKVPVMIYNQPRRCGVNVPPAIIARLAKDYAQVVMLEETRFDQVVAIKARAGDTISIFNKFPFWLPGAAVGCEGFYARTPFIPGAVQELYEVCASGKHDDAKKMFYDRYDLYSMTTPGDSVMGLKFALTLVGFEMGGVRKPLSPDLSPETERLFRQTLDKYGLTGTVS